MVDYNNFAKSFAHSRKNMRWEELEYFFSLFSGEENIGDIWCGSGRFLEQYLQYFWIPLENYIGIDLSEKLLEQAQKDFPRYNFIQGNMLDIKNILEYKNVNTLVMIASFHHLQDITQRLTFLKTAYQILPKWWKIYMTNWFLDSDKNREKYKDSEIIRTVNEFWSRDFDIKFWNNSRFYHSFSLSELDFLAKTAAFSLQENRVFDSQKNIITILKK